MGPAHRVDEKRCLGPVGRPFDKLRRASADVADRTHGRCGLANRKPSASAARVRRPVLALFGLDSTLIDRRAGLEAWPRASTASASRASRGAESWPTDSPCESAIRHDRSRLRVPPAVHPAADLQSPQASGSDLAVS